MNQATEEVKHFEEEKSVVEAATHQRVEKKVDRISRIILNTFAFQKIEEGREWLQQGKPLLPSVERLKITIYSNPILKMHFQAALNQIPKGGILYGLTPDEFFHSISRACQEPPRFFHETASGAPLYALLVDFLSNKHGQQFFSAGEVNKVLKLVLGDYYSMMSSESSLMHMNEEQPSGLFCIRAQKCVDYDSVIHDKTKPHWGFNSWNDWFTRKLKPEARPVDQRANSIIHVCQSFPVFHPEGQKGRNPVYNAKAETMFWLKGQEYSLYDMFAAREKGITDLVDSHFVGGTVYHAFLNQWCYHRWHSPVSGTIVKTYHLPGAYFLINPTLKEVPLERQTELYLDSLPMHCCVNVRRVFIIQLDDSQRYVGLVMVGLVEVSSCVATVKEGQKVKKGDELGYFAFGGSTYALVLDKQFELTFNPQIFEVNYQTSWVKKQLVNTMLATYK